MTREQRIAKAIKELKLTKKDLREVTSKNLDNICMTAKVRMIDVMAYLRFGHCL